MMLLSGGYFETCEDVVVKRQFTPGMCRNNFILFQSCVRRAS